mgnify:CR=1 FL=1
MKEYAVVEPRLDVVDHVVCRDGSPVLKQFNHHRPFHTLIHQTGLVGHVQFDDRIALVGNHHLGSGFIDYGPVGQFNHREQLVEIFTDIGCHPRMLESNHGHNPIIELIDDHHAKGSWELAYQVLNSREKTLTQIAMIYRDEYRCVDSHWKISASTTQTLSTLVYDISNKQPVLVHAA